MRLHTTITFAYALKVWVVAHELGLSDSIGRFPKGPQEDEYLREDNLLCHVPTLIRDDGFVLSDSTVIRAYLDTLQDGFGQRPSLMTTYHGTLEARPPGHLAKEGPSRH